MNHAERHERPEMRPRRGQAKPLEPYHRERYGAEMSARELTGFIARPYAGVGLL